MTRTSRYIDRFDVILLDMMGTFMFGGDRFSGDENHATTYREVGGNILSDQQVNYVISEVFRRMSIDYDDPALYERFPPVAHYVGQVLAENGLPHAEVGPLDNVFAAHETGVVPDEHAAIIGQLAQTHRLGVVSNLWGHARLILDELERTGVGRMFDAAVFSSDYGINKPSPLLFGEALDRLGADRARAVLVGDSLRYDVAGAQAAGISAVWVSEEDATDGGAVRPGMTIGHLRELLTT